MQTTFACGDKMIRLDVFQPKHPPQHPVPAILLLHGAGGNTSFWLDRIVPLIAPIGVSVYAVHYFDRTGTTRADAQTLSDGVHVPLWLETARAALIHVAQLPSTDPNRIALVGVSLGAFLSLALATQPATPAIRAIVDVSGGLVPPYEAGATSAFPSTLILHGESDTVVGAAYGRSLEALLSRLSVPHEAHYLAGEGHWFSEAGQHRLLALIAAFLQQQLQPKV